jgi:hypothetical protein
MKFLNKGQKYVYFLRDLNEKSDWEIYGREAILASYLKHQAIKISNDIVISSYAFDDFILENNLSEKITKILSGVRPLITETARDASEQIHSLIFSSKIPVRLLNEVKSVLNTEIDNLSNPILTLELSNIMPDEVISKHKSEWYFTKSDEVLKKSLLRAIAHIFTTDSIEMRINSYYKEEITTAFLLKFIPRSEITAEIQFLNKNTYLLKGYFGVKEPNDSDVDIYQYDSTEQREVSKNIYVQKHMSVFNKVDEKGEVSFMQVDVSESWQSKPKLNDDLREKIYQCFYAIHKSIKHPIKLKLHINSGDIYATGIKLLDSYENSFEKVNISQSDMKNINQLINLSTELQNQDEHNIDKTSKVDIDTDLSKIQKEIQNVVKGQIQLNMREEENDSSKDPKIDVNIVDMSNLSTQNFQKDYKENDLYVIRDAIFKTKIFIELSRLTPSRVSSIKHFYGSMVDGTELIISAGCLPEKISTNPIEKASLIDKFALHIFTASKSVVKSIYTLSNIDKFEYTLLDAETDKHLGDERLIFNNDALDFEISIIKRVRRVYEIKNLSICLPASRNVENLLELKKLLHNRGIRRSNTMQIYIEIGYPSLMRQIEHISPDDFDGVIFNLNKIYSSFYHRTEFVSSEIDKFGEMINDIAKTIMNKNLKIFYMGFDIDVELLNILFKNKFEGIIFTNLPNPEILEFIWEKDKKD